MQHNTLIKAASALGAALLMSGIGSAHAADYAYTGGLATICTSTCNSFASLSAPPSASTLEGNITVDVGASDSFVAADVTDFSFEVFNPGLPVEPFDGTNPTTANPLPLDTSVAAVRPSNTAGTVTTGGNTDADGNFTDGTILLEFTAPPFSDNGAWVVLDVGTGTAQVCLFFDANGCIPGATETVVIETRGFLNAGGSAFEYNGGKAVLCTGTCAGFAALDGPPTPSTLSGTVDINVGASASFSATDVTDFNFLVTSPAAPLEPFDGTNPTTANPLPVNAAIADVRDTITNGQGTFTTGGNTDANGDITDGVILFEFNQPPFSDNGAWVVFDVGTGTAQVCLFFSGGGCIEGATETIRFETPGFAVEMAADTDGDGVADDVDNCVLVANSDQRDTNGDGFGNICDADFNGDCIVNPIDLGIFRAAFFQSGDLDEDLNGDGIVNPIDLGIFRAQFFGPPGPNSTGTCP